MPKRKYSWNNENSKITTTKNNNNKKLNSNLEILFKNSMFGYSAEMCGKEHTHRQNR